MNIYEDANIVVKSSSIEGLGVYAKRVFKKGEIILPWNPIRIITHEDIDGVLEEEKRYITKRDDGTSILMNIPERFVNHSCDPNTNAIKNADVAIRDIRAGEEVTADYVSEGAPLAFVCRCGSKRCRTLLGN